MNDSTLQKENKSFLSKVGEFFTDKNGGFQTILKKLRKQNGWLFLLPAIALMCLFTFYPIVNSLTTAFKQNYDALANTYDGWGIGNFVTVIKGGISAAEFKTCLINTLILAFVSVPVSIIISLLISVALNSIKALQKAYQTIFFLPYLTNALAMGAVFATFFQMVGTQSNTETLGLVNDILVLMGLNHVNWMNIGSSAIANYFVIIVYSTWSGLPFKILIIFSALQNVGKQYYDAAKIDGATKTTVLTKITVPLISPMLSYLLITGIMGALKSYSSIVGLFGQYMGPYNNYEMGTMVGYIYDLIGQNLIGHAAAGSLILFVIIMIFTAINTQVSKKRVHY